MLKSILRILIIIITVPQASAQITEKVEPPYIQTVQFKGATELSELPIIRLGQSLELTFDALNGDEADYFYRITHHNFDWTPSDLSKSEYLDGFDDVRITEYQNSLNTLQIYSHYKLIIPNRDTRTIKKSGNYLLSIFSSNGDLIFTRKFLVVEDIASVGVEIKRARDLNVIEDRKSTRLNSSHVRISYAVFCLK